MFVVNAAKIRLFLLILQNLIKKFLFLFCYVLGSYKQNIGNAPLISSNFLKNRGEFSEFFREKTKKARHKQRCGACNSPTLAAGGVEKISVSARVRVLKGAKLIR